MPRAFDILKRGIAARAIPIAIGAATALSASACLEAEDFGSNGSKAFLDAKSLLEECEVKCLDAKFEKELKDGKTYLRLDTGFTEEWPGVAIKPKDGKPWNLSGYRLIGMELFNASDKPQSVYWRIDNEGGDGERNCVQLPSAAIAPGESKLFVLPLGIPMRDKIASQLKGLKGGLDSSAITQMILFQPKPAERRSILIGDVKLLVKDGNKPVESFLPFMDAYGQFMHWDWPGKTRSDEDLKASAEAEKEDLKANPGPKGWDVYGGWADGPSLEATGNFRTQKLDGKWWLVDPAGKLFWSSGITCVRPNCGVTKIEGRESYFAEIPSEGPLTKFKSKSLYDFSEANLYRKYGEGWRDCFNKLAHERLRSWGVNTIGNWSDEKARLAGRTPYTVPIETKSAKIEKSVESKMPDPFDPSFEKSLETLFEKEASSSGADPMCIGYFIENELPWAGEKLAAAVLECGPEQAAKKEFARTLKEKYGSIERLNAAWGEKHKSWDALLASTKAPAQAKASSDLKAFSKAIAIKFFSTARDRQRKAVPSKLLLGCRFARTSDDATEAAAEFCDVVSFNIYRDSIKGFSLPQGIDKPVMIGEFHFGAVDRGLFNPGVVSVETQEARGRAYKNYIASALADPTVVGAHWFQFADQPASGRGDGENYQIGFVDICDKPYMETVAASREIGGRLYGLRAGRERN